MKFLLQHYFEDSFRMSADALAIEHGDATYRYRDIAALADRMTNAFAATGITRGDTLVLLSQVTPQVIACMIACLRLGIVYVPLNIFAPVDWLANVVRKSGARHIIHDESFTEIAHALHTRAAFANRFCINADGTGSNVLDATFPAATLPELLADDLAYILFTSGSTGDPKGIMISHRNAYTFVEWMRTFFALTPADRVLSRAPLQFDLSVFDIFSTFAAGAQLVIVPHGFSEAPEDIVTFMRERAISIIYTVPSAYIRLHNKGGLARGIPSLRLALYAGEPFPTPYLRKVMQDIPATVFWNIYGPTETNIITHYKLASIPETDDSIPIGKPVFDTEIFIVDDALNCVPDGEIGEILVRGGTIFRGYLNDQPLTDERLVRCSWHPNPDLFCRTGDLGRIMADGNIAYHGRRDNMVKTRGYRVEIDEVELALSSIEGVAQAAIVAVADPKYTNTPHAFIQPSRADSSLDDIKAALAAKLPSYMMPRTFRTIAEFPKTSTAKIDRVGLRRVIEDEQRDVA
jgi:amino acid adenylation domain-containing protein